MATTKDGPGAFGSLLRNYRATAGLSQEELAEQAGLSRRGIADLERGERRMPHPATVRRLANALGLEGADRLRLLTSVHATVPSEPRQDRTTIEPTLTTSAVQSDVIPLVGRTDEWEQLLTGWRNAAKGMPGLVVLQGEPGIGKTRLADELLAWAVRSGVGTATARVYAAEGNLSYAPVAEWLRSETLQPAVRGLDADALAAVCRLLPELGNDRAKPDLYQSPAEPQQRLWFFRSLARATLSTHRPLLLLLDDLQWCDQDTLEWLHYLLRFDSGAALQIVGTMRTGEVGPQHPLTALLTHLRRSGQVTEIPLMRLTPPDVAELATALAGRELDPVELERLYDDTEGQPLHVVETMRAGLGSTRSVPRSTLQLSSPERIPIAESGSLPAKVHAVITARLAQLSDPARETARLAATIGRSFTLDLLVQASACEADNLVAPLDELWERQIVRERDAFGYDFTHDRIREVAYEEIRPAQRRLLHGRVADALERASAPNFDSVSARIAAHYDRAGQPDRAIDFYTRAADAAQRVYANEEAIGLLNRALVLFELLPASLARDERELAAQTALAVSLVATRGYGADDVMDVFQRSRELAQRLNKPLQPPLLRGLAIAAIAHAEFQFAHDLGDQLLEQARRGGDPVVLVEAHYVLGVTLFWKGHFAAARSHLEAAISHYSVDRSQMHLTQYSQDPAVVCLIRLAVVLWFLDESDEATRCAERSVALGRQVSHPFSLCYALAWQSVLCALRGDTRATRLAADAAIAISREHALEIWRALASTMRGWAEAHDGDREIGIEAIQSGTADLNATGNLFFQPFLQGLLAEQYANVGRFDAGLSLVDEALAMVQQTGEYCWEADLYWRKGILLQLRGDDQTRAAFRDALASARRHGAKAIERRAESSLASQGQHGTS